MLDGLDDMDKANALYLSIILIVVLFPISAIHTEVA